MHPDHRTRLRAVGAMFTGVVLMTTAMVGASAVATLVAADALGSAWSGAPNAAGVLGTAVGALGLAALMARRGRRTGVLVGYLLAVLGGVLSSAAMLFTALPALFGGMVLLGIGNGGAQLSRYAAAELYPPNRRGFVLGAMVWAGTVGAVIGPNLIAPSATAAGAFHLPPLVGSYVVAMVATLAAGLATVVIPHVTEPHRDPSDWRMAIATLSRPTVKVALAAMVAAHFTMVAVMTMTPLHIQLHNQGLHVVGTVLSAHMLGMFVLAPLSGRLADRLGGLRVICTGIGTLLAAALLAASAPVDDLQLPLALFLLGYGWNLCFVGGSSILSRDLPLAAQSEAQGFIDAIVWSTSALASLASGALLALGGYFLVAVVGGMVAVLPLALVGTAVSRSHRRRFEAIGETPVVSP